jgi:hypothetical protein
MKILNRTNLGFLGTVALGVFIAWCVAVPQQTAGEQLRGNCKTCITETFITCSPRIPDGRVCGKQALQCIALPGDGICYKGSPSPCFFDSNCQALWHEACVGG